MPKCVKIDEGRAKDVARAPIDDQTFRAWPKRCARPRAAGTLAFRHHRFINVTILTARERDRVLPFLEVERRGLGWRHYAIEAWGLGTFMLVAGVVAVALASLPAPFGSCLAAHPISARAIFGVAMGATAASIVYSPWGARSGAHLNPAVTLTYALLGKMSGVHAFGYGVAQFAGGAAGFFVVRAVAGNALIGPPTHAIVTKPGLGGTAVAFAAETTISFILMSVVLVVSNASKRLGRYTGAAAATLIALFITFEAPLSGMSMNPARTLASALQERDFTDIWLYFAAPPLGMLLAAGTFVMLRGPSAVRCGRLNHAGTDPCPFDCTYDRPESSTESCRLGSA